MSVMSNGEHQPFPAFRDLPRTEPGGIPLARGVFGATDQIGTLNHITQEATRQAAGLVRLGKRYNLNLPLHEPLGSLPDGAHRRRRAPRQTLIKDAHSGLMIRDEKIDDLFTQASTQWDGLTHIGDPEFGFYNGVADGDVTQQEGTRNGIEHFVEWGIASRGVIVDLPRFFEAKGRAWSAVGGFAATAADVAECLHLTNVTLRQGDILLVRTGWSELFGSSSSQERERLYRGRDFSGLSGSLEMWEFLWDSRVAAVASDSVAVEVMPFREGHPTLHLGMARLGLVLGELFDLDALARDCAEAKDATCFLVSVPLNLRGGVGSPANATAIR
jgi:hypothetical protein